MASSARRERPLSFAPSVEEYAYIEDALSQLPPKARVSNRNSGANFSNRFSGANFNSFESEEQRSRIDPIEKEKEIIPEFKPGYRFYMAFASLAVLAMMVSLDGTSVSVALPVRHCDP